MKKFIIISVFFISKILIDSSTVRASVNSYYAHTIDANTRLSALFSRVKSYNQEGIRRSILDIDYQTSIGRACYLQYQFPNQNWILTPSSPTSAAEPISCQRSAAPSPNSPTIFRPMKISAEKWLDRTFNAESSKHKAISS